MTLWNAPTSSEVIELAAEVHAAGLQLSGLMEAGDMTPQQVTEALVFVVLGARCRQCEVDLELPDNVIVHFADEYGHIASQDEPS